MRTHAITTAFKPAAAFATAILFTMVSIAAPGLQNGGQPAPGASGGGQYAVRIASGMTQDQAASLQKGVIDEGFSAAIVRGSGNNFEVVIPGFPTRESADDILTDIRREAGYTSAEIVAESASAAAASGSVYRVKVADFTTEEEANRAGTALVDEGFVNLDIDRTPQGFTVTVGTFNDQADAIAFLTDVKEAGFSFAEVVQTARISAAGSAAAVDLSPLSAADQQNMRELLATAEKIERGEASANEIRALRDQIKTLTDEQRGILGTQESSRTSRARNAQEIFQIYRDFDKAVSAGNFQQAETLLAQVAQINPNDAHLATKRRHLDSQRGGPSSPSAAQPATGSGQVDPALVQKLINEGRAAESTGNRAEAIQKYREVLVIDATNSQARTKIAELESATPPPAAATAEASSDDKNRLYLYGGIGAAVLALLALLLRGRKKASSSHTPAGTSFSTADNFADPLNTPDPTASTDTSFDNFGFDTTPADPTTPSSSLDDFNVPTVTGYEEPDEPSPAPAKPVISEPVEEESLTVSLDDFNPAPAVPEPPAVAEETPAPEDDVISFNLDSEPPAAPETISLSPDPTPVPDSPEPESQGKSAMEADLEALLKGTFQQAAAEPPSPETPETLAVAEPEPEPAVEEKVPGHSVIFAQNFDQANASDMRAQWRGDYDYASLDVVEANTEGHSHVLRYNKPEGSGSATYHLDFPPVSGKVIAEFDLRCEEKNKFLLGLYLEKSEDFKQSVHTIIHQLDPSAPASLRIQGESIPYEIGTWAHLRYEIDLDNGTLNAWNNNEQIISDHKLAVVPEFLNTLSIRDNLASTGTLYLDNIRISQG